MFIQYAVYYAVFSNAEGNVVLSKIANVLAVSEAVQYASKVGTASGPISERAALTDLSASSLPMLPRLGSQ